MGVVHHSNYIRWFEECRVDTMEKEGYSYQRMEKEGIICPVVSVSCKYVSMTEFGETVVVFPKVEKFNGVRLALSYVVKNKETGEIRCTGESSHCFLNAKGNPANLKKINPECYEMFEKLQKKTSL
nr:acyl-CoA thioesterase [Eubacterium sp.]